MPQDAIAVANYFVQKSMDEKRTISPMKVQKLVYIAHGWHLAIVGDPLIKDKVGAWTFDPVIGSIIKHSQNMQKIILEHLPRRITKIFR